MHDFLTNYGLFFAETLTVLIALLIGIAGIIALSSKNKNKSQEKIDITSINEKYEDIRDAMRDAICDKAELKEIKKQEKLKEKNKKLLQKNEPATTTKKAEKSCKGKAKRRIFVINFEGDIRALAVENLRQEISAILTIATPLDEVLVKVESAGGVIHGYGLAASQLQRIRNRNIPLTVAVDKIAASGGYMMACVANRILAAPFAILGSIGVITQLPNFHRLLKKHDIDFEQISAGEYKRTLTVFGENTNKGRQKLQEEVEEAHELFKSFVTANRQIVDINTIATGEHWYGTRAQELRLVDEIMTSDDYLMFACDEADLYEVTYTVKQTWLEKVTSALNGTVTKMFGHV